MGNGLHVATAALPVDHEAVEPGRLPLEVLRVEDELTRAGRGHGELLGELLPCRGEIERPGPVRSGLVEMRAGGAPAQNLHDVVAGLWEHGRRLPEPDESER